MVGPNADGSKLCYTTILEVDLCLMNLLVKQPFYTGSVKNYIHIAVLQRYKKKLGTLNITEYFSQNWCLVLDIKGAVQ